MTDNDIIKVLECCSNAEPCENCPYQKQCDETDLAEIALDLINRQKAEIERLNNEADRLSQVVLYHDGDIADAIKEFADLSIKRICENVTPIPQQKYLVNMCIQEIENIKNEYERVCG